MLLFVAKLVKSIDLSKTGPAIGRMQRLRDSGSTGAGNLKFAIMNINSYIYCNDFAVVAFVEKGFMSNIRKPITNLIKSKSYKIYNWGGGTNTTDTGCKYLIEETEVDETGGGETTDIDYTPGFTGTRTNSARGINSITFASTSYPEHAANSLSIGTSEFSQCYVDKSDVTMKAGAGYTIVYKNYTLEDITDGAYSIQADDTGTGIDEIFDEVKGETGKIKGVYDLTGRKVEITTKGIYIIDGKKRLIK